ncbi:MAG TPA: alpha/beta family hydrolase, partial [Candidatus Eisenbacteria bacterium]|nr:alpha/beta family hydrolase [Candidatus Eisenbacteria bacterium]
FNFRGVGRSEGTYSGWDGEVGDVAAAAVFARERTGIQPLWLAGFSFGSWVSAKFALTDAHIEQFIGLGMPVTTNIDGRTFEFLDRAPAPMLIVQGTLDRYGSTDGIHALAERLRAAGGEVELRLVEGADHFFTGHLTQLAGALRDGLGLRGA